MPGIHVGLAAETSGIVDERVLATTLGSGGVAVYGTPAMIALIESAAVAALAPVLDEGQSSVGIAIEVRHLSPTPPGERVRARAEVIEVQGHRVTFGVQAWDETELIGEGTHTRYVIDVDRFMQRVQARQTRGARWGGGKD
jgi:predicted thioesterase